MADNRHDDQTDDEDTNDRKKHANWRRNPRVRQSGEGSVFKVERTLPSGNQRVAYRAVQRIKLPNGKSLRVAGEGSSPQEAREALYRNRVKRQIALGELPPEAMGDLPQKTVRTLSDALWDWLDNKSDIQERSKYAYEAKIRNHLVPDLREQAVRLLTYQTLNNYFVRVLPGKKKPSGEPLFIPNTIRQIYWLLDGVLEREVKSGHIVMNPLKLIKPPKKYHRNKNEETKLQNLGKWLPEHLVKDIEGSDDEFRWFLALSGVRQSEVLGLTDDCLKARKKKNVPGRLIIKQQLAKHQTQHGCGRPDPETGKYPCGRQSSSCPNVIGESGYYIKEMTKTPEGYREIPLVEPIYAAAMKHMKKQRLLRKSDSFKPLDGAKLDKLLFTTDTRKPRRHQDDRKMWKTMLKDARVHEDLRLHDARHLAATTFFSMGVQPEKIAMIMGWSPQTLQEMLRNYAHPSSSILNDDMVRFAEKLTERRDAH